MEKSIIATGKTIDLAIQAALNELKMDRDAVSVEVLENAKSGFLGIGASPAKVKVTYEAPDAEVKQCRPRHCLPPPAPSRKSSGCRRKKSLPPSSLPHRPPLRLRLPQSPQKRSLPGRSRKSAPHRSPKRNPLRRRPPRRNTLWPPPARWKPGSKPLCRAC